MDSKTRKKRGKWICKGLVSESRDKNGNVFHVMDDCSFQNDYDINPNRLGFVKQRIAFNKKSSPRYSPRTLTQRRIHPIHYPKGYNMVSPSRLIEKRTQLKRVRSKPRRKYSEEIVITPEDNDPIWLYANYTGMIKDYSNKDVYVVMYSERRD